MILNAQTQKVTDKISSSTKTKLKLPDEPRILIVCDDDSIAEPLNIAFQEAGLISERAKTITAGCESARSGRFQVVVTTPVLGHRSWRHLVEIASHYDLGFVVVLLASNLDLNQSSKALADGVFDIIAGLHELPKATEVVKRVLWAAYLKGGGPAPETISSSRAA